MSPTHTGRNADGELHTFERNRYFHGKLMTARDMLAEQDYHGDRLSATNRYVSGRGVVCGVDVDELVTEENQLSATLTPGFALDGFGRPIVVTGEGSAAVTNPDGQVVPTGGTIDLYLRYDECDVETVPRPGSENACEAECTYNRILEVFDVVFESVRDEDPSPEPSKGYKAVGEVRFPEPGDLTEGNGSVLDDPLLTIARDYYARHLDECRNDSESWVFLGRFTDPDEDGVWTEVETDDGLSFGSLAYTNDMLYAAIARHTADFGNPHAVTLDVDEGPDPSVRVVDDESPGGAVGLGSSDSTLEISGTARSGDDPSEVDLTVAIDEVSRRIEAVRNIEGATPNADGLIDLVGTGAVSITQGPGDNGITFDVPVAFETIEGIGPGASGNIDVGSPDGTIAIGTGTSGGGDPQIRLDVADSVLGRLERLERYVRQSSLWCGCAFDHLLERFGISSAETLASRLRTGLEDQIYEGESSYLAFFLGRGDNEDVRPVLADLRTSLERLTEASGVDHVSAAVSSLEAALDEDTIDPDAFEVAVALHRVCESAECVERIRQELNCVDFHGFLPDEFSERSGRERLEHDGLVFTPVVPDESFELAVEGEPEGLVKLELPEGGVAIELPTASAVEAAVTSEGDLDLVAFDSDGTEIARDTVPGSGGSRVVLRVQGTGIDRVELRGAGDQQTEESYLMEVCFGFQGSSAAQRPPTTTIETNATDDQGNPKLEVNAAPGQSISGRSNLDPGETLIIEFREGPTGETFLLQAVAVVNQEFGYTAEVDFSNVQPGTEFRVDVHNGARTLVSMPGEVV